MSYLTVMDLLALRSPTLAADRLVPVARARREQLEVPAAVALAIVSIGAAVVAPSVVRWAGALAVVAMVVVFVVERDPSGLRGRLGVVAGTTLLGIAGAGVVHAVGAHELWRPMVALAAYPLLGRALLNHVSRYRLVRPTDVIVEAVLIGAAASIVLQVGLDVWGGGSGSDAGTAHAVAGALAALLVGVDVALGVIVARAIALPAARHVSLGAFGVGIICLLSTHLVATVQHALGEEMGTAGAVLAAGALVGLGVATILSSIVPPPSVAATEPPLFSTSHATIVVMSVVAAPVVLLVQVLRDISVSGSIAAGAGISALVLAGHVVTLLRERASSEHQASHDSLTDLPNRLLFTDRLERAIAHAARNGTPVGVLYIDLDRFKDVNDSLGHDAGDRLLEAVARRLQQCARHEDTVARLAGDEFAVLLPHLAAADDILLVSERVLAALHEPVDIGGHSFQNAGSIGAAVYPFDGQTPQDLLNAADAAMYQAKDAGGGRVGVFSAQLHHVATTRLELETSLVRAIEQDELVLFYQPIVDAKTGRTCGAEALVRWNHPERGMVPPGEFIPVAELSDLIVRLGDWVIREACHELARWSTLGVGDRYVTVNVSSRHFHADLVSTVTGALRESGVDPSRLIVELTESAAVDDVELVAERLRELRQLGVKAAIDDFGTGYCGLQYLGDLPVSTLKLDRSFVQTMTPRSAAIVAATIAMSRSLGLTMVAEGVETAEQQRFLEAQGCDRLQGYHLGRPMPADELVDRLRDEDRTRADAESERAQYAAERIAPVVPLSPSFSRELSTGSSSGH